MNQVANTSADLAEVLKIQQTQSVDMRRRLLNHEKIALGLMKKMWGEAEAMAQGDKEANNPKWLEQQIKSLEHQLGMERNQNQADQKRITDAKKSHEIRLRRVLRARNRMEQLEQVKDTEEFNKMQEEYAAKAAPARAAGAQERLKELKESIALRKDPIKLSEQSEAEEADSEQALAEEEAEFAELEDAFHAKLRADARDHPVTRSILPVEYKKQPPKPFAMDVEIKWVDLRNAEYAAGSWPEPVVHDILNLRSSRNGISLLSAEQYRLDVHGEVVDMVNSLRRQQMLALGLKDPEAEPEKTGVWKYIPEIKNPFKRAEA